ncbi:MAG: class A beta-lactamase-related serine hydrolase [Paramuribaculum sp.]|nr:class A beta-lactamase-related serine hydrolase [Paramuribaculum sp.]
MNRFFAKAVVIATILTSMGSCVKHSSTSVNELQADDKPAIELSGLRDSLQAVADRASGEVGIALIMWSGDTLTVNNTDTYPLMSVFKLHQALAVCHDFEKRGISIDTVISIDRQSLNPETWSPMLKEKAEDEIRISVRELMQYTLTKSDNNASNLMFDRFVPVADADSFIATLVPRDGFQIRFRESDMQKDHALSYENHTSPLSAAMLIKKVYADSILSGANLEFVRETLFGCATGVDRISLPLSEIEGIRIAHKTGSGYRDSKGRLIAHNDVAYIMLPDGRSYALAVFVSDFEGDEKGASEIISEISSKVYGFIGATDSVTD